MAHITADRVQETSTSTGTGNFTLSGTSTGFRSFSAVMATGDTTFIAIVHRAEDEWEVTLATRQSDGKLARTTVLASSNGGAAVNFSAGTKDVYLTEPAARLGRTLVGPNAGLGVTNGNGVSGNPTIALANDLAALEGLGSTGFAVRTGSDTWAQRSLTAPAAGVTIANNTGVSGNPTFALANDLAAVEGLSSNGIAVRTGNDAWAVRTLTYSNGIAITNPSGSSGAPAFALEGVALALHTGTTGVGSDMLDVVRHSELGAAAYWEPDVLRGAWPATKGAAYQITMLDWGRTLIAESGTLTWTLPLLSDLSPGWFVKIWNRSGNNLTLSRSGSSDVIGAASTSLTVATASGITIAYRDSSRFERIA